MLISSNSIAHLALTPNGISALSHTNRFVEPFNLRKCTLTDRCKPVVWWETFGECGWENIYQMCKPEGTVFMTKVRLGQVAWWWSPTNTPIWPDDLVFWSGWLPVLTELYGSITSERQRACRDPMYFMWSSRKLRTVWMARQFPKADGKILSIPRMGKGVDSHLYGHTFSPTALSAEHWILQTLLRPKEDQPPPVWHKRWINVIFQKTLAPEFCVGAFLPRLWKLKRSQ